MKKLILILTALHVFAFSIGAQTSADREKLRELNRQVVNNFRAGNMDGALTLAKEAIELTSKVAPDDDETASAYFNLGTVYRFKKKYKEATENLQKALSIYQLNAAKNAKSVAKTLHGLADVYALDGDEKKAAENYTLAFTAAEIAYGKDSKELLPFLRSIGEVYIYEKRSDEAQEIFVRRYRIVSKNSPKDSEQLEAIEDDFHCFLYQNFKPEGVSERSKKFSEAIQTDEEKKNIRTIADTNTVSGGGVVKNAANLVKPEYPASARSRRAQGVIPVRVTIDETGNVIKAKAICGDMDLRRSSEDAARKSKFSPTTLSGQPVKVTGIIVYNFVAP